MTDVTVEFDEAELIGDTTLIESILAAAYERWAYHAYMELRTSYSDYVRAMRPPVVIDNTSGYLELAADRAPLAGYVESGMTPYDMRRTHIPPGEDHAVIAFHRNFPGKSPGSPFGEGYRRHLGAAKAEKIGQVVANYARKMGRGSIRAGLAPTLPGHATDLYARTERNVNAQAPFVTFRTISNNAGSAAWEHPGIEARNLLGKVAEDLASGLAAEIVDAYFDS